MSRILSRISMFTGQISSHALHVVHAHSSSDVIRSKRLSAVTVISASVPTGGDVGGEPGRVHHLAGLQHDLAGSSGLPVACAGHTEVQRPQIVHASVSKSCFQVKSSTVDAPNVSSSVSMRFGISRHRALGPRAVLQVHVHRAREHVAQHRGRQDHEEAEERDDVDDPRPAVRVVQAAERPAVDDARERPADERPLLEVGRRRRAASRSAAIRNASVVKPVTAMTRNVTQDHEVLGLGLDPDPVRPLPVAAGERPQEAGEEHEAEQVADERVRLVRPAVEELQRVRELVVDLEDDGDDEEDEEAEVDERVHDARGGVPQQRAHPDALAEVAQAPVDVALGGAPVVGLARARSCGPAATRATRRGRGRWPPRGRTRPRAGPGC